MTPRKDPTPSDCQISEKDLQSLNLSGTEGRQSSEETLETNISGVELVDHLHIFIVFSWKNSSENKIVPFEPQFSSIDARMEAGKEF